MYSTIKATNSSKTARPNPILLSWVAPEVPVVCVPEFAGVEVIDDPVPLALVDALEGEEPTTFVLETVEVPEAEELEDVIEDTPLPLGAVSELVGFATPPIALQT
jgi:hypothetical protein